jgi:predicted deacylase
VTKSDQTLIIDGQAITPGKRQRLDIPVSRLPTQTLISLPVIVINGKQPGPRLWLSAAIHGDEINGVEIIRQVLEKVKPRQLRGALITVPVVNVFGFIEQSRYLPDRRDLNRSFPGSPHGSLASHLAYLFMEEIVNNSTHGIDLHTAAVPRINLPHIRANLEDEITKNCALAFGAPLMLHSAMRDGSLRQAACKQGIPVLLYEAGETLRFDTQAIQIGVEGIFKVMNYLGMYSENIITDNPPSLTVWQTKWVRASRGGILHLDIALGQKVAKKQVLGLITDAFGDTKLKVRAPIDGIVISHTQNPLINQGDGIVNLALIDDN